MPGCLRLNSVLIQLILVTTFLRCVCRMKNPGNSEKAPRRSSPQRYCIFKRHHSSKEPSVLLLSYFICQSRISNIVQTLFDQSYGFTLSKVIHCYVTWLNYLQYVYQSLIRRLLHLMFALKKWNFTFIRNPKKQILHLTVPVRSLISSALLFDLSPIVADFILVSWQ